ncbi:ABC transporter permease [Amycolatopsis anabasis]|uniref:ABC transporter permease n=1 Tax=Amycolatopsis anabasis TaxID=1840409 RepID=UPI00131E2762|nr:ABC transporter permease [Amycolatopsis anabasis]
MNQLLFGVTGLSAGAVYAALAMALVVTFRGTGGINFAQGAMAMWPAYVFDELRTTGDFVLPLPGWIGRFHVADHVGTPVAFVVAVLSGSLLGALAHLLVFRPLRGAPVLAPVVASVGLLLVVQELVVLDFGDLPRAVAPVLPTGRIAGLPVEALLLTGVVILLGLGLRWYSTGTRLGLATRAAAENERAAALLGYAPDRLSAVTSVLAATVAGAVAVLAAPLTGLNPGQFTLLVVPALACALVGRLTSPGIACAAGLVLGASQAEVGLLTTQPWWPDWLAAGVVNALPVLVIVVALTVLGARLPQRGAAVSRPLPEVVPPRCHPVAVTLLVGAGALCLVFTHGGNRFGVLTSMIMALLSLSFVVLTGLVGQISLAQVALAGVAGFTLSRLADGLGIPFPISTLLAAATATAVGVVAGLPALRTRGVQLAVVTLAAAVAIEQVVLRNPNLVPLAGNPIPPVRLFGLDLAVRKGTELARLPFALLVLAVLAVTGLLVANLMRSGTGRALLAVRSNERAAASVGIDVATAKLFAFGFASFIAGLSGALIGYSRGQLSAESFGVFVGLSVLAAAYLGGITSISGALVTGLIAPLGIGYVVLDRYVNGGKYYALIAGALLIVAAIANPSGIAGKARESYARLRGVLSR